MDEKLIKTLKKLDLTSYEAKAYITLNSLTSGTAVEISKESGIPRSKIYDILKKLETRNFIEISDGKPLTFTVIPPEKSFKKQKEEIIAELEEAEEYLNEIYTDKISHVQAPIWLIPTDEKIIAKELEIIKQTRNKINIRIGFLNEGEAEMLINSFKSLSPSTEVKILAAPECEINGEKIDIIKTFEEANIKNLHIEKTKSPFMNLFIKDGEELFRIISKQHPDKKEAIPNTKMGIWNKYKEVCENFDENFEKEFIEIKRKAMMEINI